MKKKDAGISRRSFLGSAAGAAAASLVGGSQVEGGNEKIEAPRSRVVLIRRREVLAEDGSVRPEILHRMLNEGVTALMGAETSAAAWKQLVRADDIVGIKSNVWTKLRTPPALEDAIRQEVEAVGVASGNVAVDDRGVGSNPIFQRATALINVRPMRTHHWSGLGTCIKNMITFVDRPSDYHADACATLGALWHLPQIAAKVRLNILVMLTPQFHGVGPHSFSKRFVWPYHGLILGMEPASVDATGARIIEEQRNRFFNEKRPISPPPHHIEIAGSRYGLGATSAEKIDLIRLGDDDE